MIDKDIRRLLEKADLRVFQMECLIELIRTANLSDIAETDSLDGVGLVMEELLGDIRTALNEQYDNI